MFRGLEVVEAACNIGQNLMGETLGNLSKGLDTYTYRQPLGVTAGICPFNFPAMIPLWMFPTATACGNTMILKPSEKDPGAAMILVKLAQEAGIPDGVVQVVHGGVDTVNFLCDAPSVRAISFVGGNQAGEHIFDRGTKQGKRVQVRILFPSLTILFVFVIAVLVLSSCENDNTFDTSHLFTINFNLPHTFSPG